MCNGLLELYDHLLYDHEWPKTCMHEQMPIKDIQYMLGPVHNTTLNNALRCVAFASTLVGTQRDARIDSDPIFAFLCVGSLRLIA